MVQFNFQRISQVPSSFFKQRHGISVYLKELVRVIKEKDCSKPESFLILPEVKNFTRFAEKSTLIVLVGVGGSSLGSQAIYEALKHRKNLKNFLVLDSLNPLFLSKAIDKIKETKQGESVIFVVSKSGRTFETTANFLVFFEAVKRYRPLVYTFSERDSVLWQYGIKNNFKTVVIPKSIGGRYSLFTNSHLLVLSATGVDVKNFILGAGKADKDCLKAKKVTSNPALSSALTIFYHYLKRKNIYSNIVFPPDLEYFGKWYVQLMAESLGKDGKGITPSVTTGTTDFHAIGQLYFDGPKDKLVNFVFTDDIGIDYKIGYDSVFSSVFPGMEGKGMWELNKAIFEGVKKAYLKKGLPFTETILSRLDEQNLGYLFRMKMFEIIFLAKLMKVNAFNQPGVELYKTETRKILQNKRP